MSSLSERDRRHLWHPLTQHKLHPEHLPIVGAQGVYLYDDQGRSYIDGISSWYTCMYGHCNPRITERVKEQLDTLDQVVFSGFTHPPAIELSERLIGILPEGMEKIFFSDNGSTSVDVAIKMSLQYFFNRGEKRDRIIAFHNAFHGDTFGAMSVSGLSVYNGPFGEFLLSVDRVEVPEAGNWPSVKESFRALLETGKVAAFIYEPLVQGAAAMHMYEGEFLDQMLAMSERYGTLTIADEVMTGFGKTGIAFASDYMNNKPDILCLSKSLTAGVAPMALTCCTKDVYEAFYDPDIRKGFFHGHTYSANPLACAAAIAGIELLTSTETRQQIKWIEQCHREFSRRIGSHPMVRSVRVLGVIFALDIDVETDRYGGLRDRLYRFYMDNGVFLRPLGNTVYMLPPYVIGETELQTMYSVIEKSLNLLADER